MRFDPSWFLKYPKLAKTIMATSSMSLLLFFIIDIHHGLTRTIHAYIIDYGILNFIFWLFYGLVKYESPKNHTDENEN